MANVAMNGYFKCVEVVGTTKEEALEKAPFTTWMKDATPAFKKWKEKNEAAQQAITEASIKQFMLDYTARWSKNAPGVGFYITDTPAVRDTRNRPWKFEDVKNEEGKRKLKTFHVLKEVKSIKNGKVEFGEVLGRVDTTKKNAKELAKEIIANGFHGTLASEIEKHVVEGSAIEFFAKYEPSKNAHPGTYRTFGIVAENKF